MLLLNNFFYICVVQLNYSTMDISQISPELFAGGLLTFYFGVIVLFLIGALVMFIFKLSLMLALIKWLNRH